MGKWPAIGAVALLGSTGLAAGLDLLFRIQVSEPFEGGQQAVAIASDGFVHSRRALFLVCRDNRARFVTKARLAHRDGLQPNADAAKATVLIFDSTRWQDFPRNQYLSVDTQMRLTAVGLVDTLISHDIPHEVVDRIGQVMAGRSANKISVHTMERSIRFDLDDRSAEVQSFARDCRPR